MTYENAPATKLLATHCCCCGRPLVDSISVERGIGPDCAKKYGYDEAQEPVDIVNYCNLMGEVPSTVLDGAFDSHKESNKLVHTIALQPKNHNQNLIMAIYYLGFKVLATKLAIKTSGIEVKKAGNGEFYHVFAPFSQDWLFNVRGIKGRKWNASNKCWEIPVNQRISLWNALLATYPGSLVVGSNGIKPLQ